MDSFSLIGFLPDKMVIWIQFGTRYFIDYIYLIIGIPLLVDFLVVWSPKIGMFFGKNTKSDSSDQISSQNVTKTVNLDDTFKFMYVYARNPNLFQSRENVENFDDELTTMKKTISSESGDTSNDSDEISNKKSQKADTKKTENVGYSLTDRLLKNGLTTIHLTFIGVVVLVNAAGYWHYSSMFDKFFRLTERGYALNYAVLDAATKEDREEVFRMQIKIEQINEVKYPEKR